MELTSQKLRKIAPELDPLRLGTGWKLEDLSKPQIMIESTFGDSHPGSGHLLDLVEEARQGVAEAGGFGARYFCTDICDGEAQGHDGINYSLPSRDMMANMIEIHANATPFDGGVLIASCDKGMPAHLMAVGRINIPSIIVTGGVMDAGPDLLTLEQIGKYNAWSNWNADDKPHLQKNAEKYRKQKHRHEKHPRSRQQSADQPEGKMAETLENTGQASSQNESAGVVSGTFVHCRHHFRHVQF